MNTFIAHFHLVICMFVSWPLSLSGVSRQSPESASPRWVSCLSWCRRSSPQRQRRRTCSGGLSLGGSLPAASVGRRWAPWPGGPSCPPSQSTCPPAGCTWRSPWCVCKQVSWLITQIHTVTLHTHTCTVILIPTWFTSFINTHETSAQDNIFTYTET